MVVPACQANIFQKALAVVDDLVTRVWNAPLYLPAIICVMANLLKDGQDDTSILE